MLDSFISFSGTPEQPIGEVGQSHVPDQEHEQDSQNSETPDIRDDSLTSSLDMYRDCIVNSAAYVWLQGALLAETTQAPSDPDIKSQIRSEVLRSLNYSRGEQMLSRKTPVEPHQALFEMDWDPRSFVEGQKYTEKKPGDAISRAIALTGSGQDCQATTTERYLSQTWPLTGSHMMALIQRLLGGEPGDSQSGKLDVFLPLLMRLSSDHEHTCSHLARPDERHGTVPRPYALGDSSRSSPFHRRGCRTACMARCCSPAV